MRQISRRVLSGAAPNRRVPSLALPYLQPLYIGPRGPVSPAAELGLPPKYNTVNSSGLQPNCVALEQSLSHRPGYLAIFVLHSIGRRNPENCCQEWLSFPRSRVTTCESRANRRLGSCLSLGFLLTLSHAQRLA